ncbi:hypothetical protein KM792_10235 [Clostridium tyrobutyricum]|uniref:hypothetical protein n=1 Tax=Clostridium tyrobutyricum TaxID=1519 RepID=UPI001C38A128|nr:hypothetical protein [Clostridium tyrobutyricum]MBV4450030.1 hypothetical protein [Clostridium tyrobutyricum]
MSYYNNLKIKEITNGQFIIIDSLSIFRYVIESVKQNDRNTTYNLLIERDIYNNPKHKNRFKFIKNFKNFDDILNFIKSKNKYKKYRQAI